MNNNNLETYWRGVQCRCEAILDEIRELNRLVSEPRITPRHKQEIKSILRNIDEVNSSNYRECEELVADESDEEFTSREDIAEVLRLIPTAGRLSIRDVSELADAVKSWRESVGLPREVV